MPSRKVVTKTGSGAKKKSRWKRFSSAALRVPGDFARGAEDAVTGLPTGVVAIAHAIDQALPASPIPGVDEGHVRSSRPLKDLGKATLKQMQEDLRHPLRDPFATTLTALSLGALGGGAAARAGTAASKASKTSGAGKLKAAAKGATEKRRPATRKLKLADKPLPEKTYKFGKPGEKPTRVYRTNRGKEVEVEANPNILVRGLRKGTIDQAYKRSVKKADEDALLGKKSKGGAYARMVSRRTEDQRTRYADNIRNKDAPNKEVKTDAVKNILRSPQDLMRLSLYVRPRYYVQNLGGTAQLLAHAGVGPGHVRAVRKIAKTDPELFSLMKAAAGETGAQAMSFGTGTGRLGNLSRKAADLANRPEANMRTVGIWKAAKDYGIDNPAELKAILKDPDSDIAQLIMTRGNESLVDYGRVGGSGAIGRKEKAFVQSGLPIFYPMMKGFSRYGARFPTQHPIQATVATALGQEGKEMQRQGIGGEPQPWFPYITPLADERSINLQNMYTFSPGADIARQSSQFLPGAERHPTLNLLQALGPTPELIYGMLSGRQLATGFEYPAETLDSYGSFLTALGDTAKGITPGSDLASAVPGFDFLGRASAAYGEPSLQDKLGLWAVGPGLYPRKTNFKKVRQPKKKKPGRKRTSSARF